MANSPKKIHHPLLKEGFFPILDPSLAPEMAIGALVEAFADAEAEIFLVRAPKLTPNKQRALLQEIAVMRDIVECNFIVHNDVALALELHAAGVHLNASSDSVADARKHLGSQALIGYSAHTLTEAISAQNAGANYVLFGAVFATPKAHDYEPVGLNNLTEVCQTLTIPVYAVGGITEANLASIKAAGAFGFSALRAVYADGTIEHAISKLGFLWEDA
jgi:thiamine-phosphate pyrophosphorylase